jgi:hypothetical protein
MPLLEGLGPHALIGTNTSSLSVTELGAKLGVPERSCRGWPWTVGLHFFNPPPVDMDVDRCASSLRDDREGCPARRPAISSARPGPIAF